MSLDERAGPEAPPAWLRDGEATYHDLWTKPFREGTNPGVLWLGSPYRDAFATLRTGILENAGRLVLTGEGGTGKTMLASVLADGLRAEGVCVAKLAHGAFESDSLRHAVAPALGLPVGSDTREAFLACLNGFLRDAYTRSLKVLLCIDEAQDLGPELLGEIEHLVRLGREAGRNRVHVLNVLLVGQTEPASGLGEATWIRARLHPLAPGQVPDYIAFRLRVAGADHELFTREAVHVVADASNGVPRVINRICDSALQTAAHRGDRVVSAKIVRDAIGEWGLAVNNEAGGTGRHRVHGRRGVRRAMWAAALILVIGLGAAVYQTLQHPTLDGPDPVAGRSKGAANLAPESVARGNAEPVNRREAEPAVRGLSTPIGVTRAPDASIQPPRTMAPARPSRRIPDGLTTPQAARIPSRPTITSTPRHPGARPADPPVENLLRYQAP